MIMRLLGAMPVPASAAVRVPPGLALTLSDADLAPMVVGEKRTVIMQLAPPAMAAVQPFIPVGIENCAASAPVMVTTGAPVATPPGFDTAKLALAKVPVVTEL